MHWGDNTDARIRDDHNIPVDKTWASSGGYNIAVQIDGEEKVAVIRGLSVANSSSGSEQTNVIFTSAAGKFVGHVCNPPPGTAIAGATGVSLTLPHPFTDGTMGVTAGVEAGCPPSGGLGSFRPRTSGEMETVSVPASCSGKVFTFRIATSGATHEAVCRWPVQ